MGFEEFFEEGFGFASTRPVADGDGIGRILGEEGKEVSGSASFVASSEIKCGVVEEFAGLIDGNAFTACALTGVDADDVFFAEGRGEQEVAEVVGKDIDGVAIGAHLEFDADVGFDAWGE